MAEQRLAGIVPPVCTPLTPDLDVDVPSLERLVGHLIRAGVDGLFVLGSTGEAAFLPDGQRRRVVETVTGCAAGQVPVVAGVIDTTTPRVIEHAAVAAKHDCSGIVATAPFYARTHPEEIERHFRLVGAATDLPLYAYDLPVSVHAKLDPAMLLTLAGDGVVAGVKDSSGDDATLRRLIVERDAAPGPAADLRVLTGAEMTADTALYMGADGVVPGLGNVDPDGYVRLLRLCRAGDWAAARTEQERLVRLFRIVSVGDPARMGPSSAGLGAFKQALHQRGMIDCPATAPPQIALNAAETARIRDILDAADLL